MSRRTGLFECRPLAPSPPEALHFSDADNAWVFSRHRDVSIALRSSCLIQARSPGDASSSSRKQPAHKEKQPDIPSICLKSQTPGWQAQIKRLAFASLERLPSGQPVDLVGEFIQPWCLDSALVLTGIEWQHSGYLASLISRLSASDAAPCDVDLKSQAKQVNKELDSFFQARGTAAAKSVLLGVAQTLPAFLASAWVALLQNRCQRKRLQEHTEQFPKATEELLRYAGPVHTLFRQAARDVHIVGNTIHSGDRVLLRLSSANRDPRQFADPDRLDFTRDVAGHLALSAGAHYCPGAAIIRMASAIATQALLDRYLAPELIGPIGWSCGTMLIWPSSLPVLLGRTAERSELKMW